MSGFTTRIKVKHMGKKRIGWEKYMKGVKTSGGGTNHTRHICVCESGNKLGNARITDIKGQ